MERLDISQDQLLYLTVLARTIVIYIIVLFGMD